MKKSKKKIIIRVLFVLLCAAALTGASVMLGSHLKKKAELSSADTDTVPITIPDPVDTSVLYPDGIPSSSDVSSMSICAADIDITLGSKQDVYDRITALSDTYNAVSVRLTSEGSLVYISPALLEYVGVSQNQLTPAVPDADVPVDETEAPDDEAKEMSPAEDVYGNLTAVAEAAKTAGLRLSAVYATAPNILSGDDTAISEIAKEKVILGELVSLGFNEIIIDGLATEDEDLSHDKVRSIITYLAKLRDTSDGVDIGITLPASVYLIPQMASKIKTLSEYADFLAIGIASESDDPDEAYSLVYESCHSLKGNFSVYNIRGIILESDPAVAEAICASLQSMSVNSVQFTVYNADPSFTPNTVSGENAPETDAYSENDYALRAEDYAVNDAEPES